jgi:hypothetical protein
MADDLAGVVARFGAALRAAGLPVGPDRCERFARAITLVRPRTPQALRECALATLVSSRDQAGTLAGVFDATFGGVSPAGPQGNADAQNGRGGLAQAEPGTGADTLAQVARAAREHAAGLADATAVTWETGEAGEEGGAGREKHISEASEAAKAGNAGRAGAAGVGAVGAGAAGPGKGTQARAAGARDAWAGAAGAGAAGAGAGAAGAGAGAAGAGAGAAGAGDAGGPSLQVLASAAERLSATDFAELTPAELLQLASVMRGLTLAVPVRRSRRQRRGPRGQADLRATLRHARQTGGHPFGIIKKSPAPRPRKLVVLCDISGSMEPYARAMLQLLYCAAGGARAEVFSFATRLTRLTKALAEPQPGLALQRAGQMAPDWLGGTRIGSSLKEFNDGFGHRGVARGAVVVVVSDGWDTGEPGAVRREMERLSRVAFRIVWVNPRAQSPGYRPLAAGMAAAWPYCDAVVSAHRLDALGELTAALADPVRRRHPGAGHGRPATRPA